MEVSVVKDKERALVADMFVISEDEVTEDQYKRWKQIISDAKEVEEPEEPEEEPEPEPDETKDAPDPEKTEDKDPPVDPEVIEKLVAENKALRGTAAEQAEQLTAMERKLVDRPPVVVNEKPRVEGVAEVWDFTSKEFWTEPPAAQTADAEEREWLTALHDFNDDLLLLSAIGGKSGIQPHPRELPYFRKWVGKHGQLGSIIERKKGFFDDQGGEAGFRKAVLTTTTGADYLPTILSSQFIETMRAELTIAEKCVNIDMPSKVLDIPGEGSTDPVVYLTAEGATVTTGDLDDRKVTLTAGDFRARSRYTDDVDEDSLIPILPLHKRKVARRMADAIEWAIVHGKQLPLRLATGVEHSARTAKPKRLAA